MPTPAYDPPKYDLYVTEQVQNLTDTLNKQRLQSGKIIKNGIKAAKNYIEDYYGISGNSKQTRTYFDQYTKSIVGTVWQGLTATIKTIEEKTHG